MSTFFANQQTIKKDTVAVAPISSNRSSRESNTTTTDLDYAQYQKQHLQDANLCTYCALPSGLTYSSQCSNPSDPPTWIPNPDYVPYPVPSPSASSPASTPTPSIP